MEFDGVFDIAHLRCACGGGFDCDQVELHLSFERIFCQISICGPDECPALAVIERLFRRGEAVPPATDIRALYAARPDVDVIIVDECQFLTGEQIDQLRELVDRENLPVLCFGLRTDFRTRLFPGSLRLFELADSITEIKTICDCGRKATVNARIDADGYVITEGSQVFLGGNDSYIAMCHKCYQDYIREHRKVELLHGTERDSE